MLIIACSMQSINLRPTLCLYLSSITNVTTFSILSGALFRVVVHTIYIPVCEHARYMFSIPKYLETSVLVIIRVVIGIGLFCTVAWGQLVISTWREDVRSRVEAHDWNAAMSIVDREVALAPQDMDV